MEVLLGGINRKLDSIEEKISEISDWTQRRKKRGIDIKTSKTHIIRILERIGMGVRVGKNFEEIMAKSFHNVVELTSKHGLSCVSYNI